MRFPLKNPVRFKNLRISKVFKMPAKFNKNEKFCFSSENAVRFYFFIFFKKINLPAKNAGNINCFFISSFKKLFRFPAKKADRLIFLNFSEFLNLSSKKRKNRNFSFLLKIDGRFENFIFLKKNNLRYFFGESRSFFFNSDLKKLSQFSPKKAGRLKSFEFLKSGNLRAKMTINRKFCF